MSSSYVLEPVKVPLKYLKFLGLWDVQGVKLSHRILQIVLHLFFIELFILLQLVNIFTAINPGDIVDLLSVLLTIVGFSIKSLNLIVNGGKVMTLIENIKELSILSHTDKPLEHLSRRVKLIHKTYKFTTVAVVVAMILMVFDIIVTFITNPNPPYKIPNNFWTPFDYEQNVFWFSVVAIYQAIDVLGTSTGAVALDYLPIFFLHVSSGFIDELCERLGQISEKNKNQMVELEKCIEIHLKLRNFVKKIEDIFSPVIFAQGAISMFTLCTVVFRLSKVSFDKIFS